MRISTNTLFEVGSARLGDLQSALAKTQEQIATGRRVLTPSDDPVAAAQALELSQAQSVNAQFEVNRSSARHNLNMQEQALQSVTGLIQDVQTLAVSAGNGALDNQQRQFLATELRGRLEDLLGLANTTDGAGNYLFSGYQSTTQPFARSGGSIEYSGDQGQRMLQVGPRRSLALSEPGSLVFEGIKTGNGRYTAFASPANTGAGIISLGADTGGPASSTTYEIRFTVPGAYDVVDTGVVPENVISTANVYTSGETINVAGMRVENKGAPAGGDVFVIAPSRSESVFTALGKLINVLETPATGAAGQAALANGLNVALRSLGNGLDSVLSTRASVGARLRELDTLDEQGSARDVEYSRSLAELQELD